MPPPPFDVYDVIVTSHIDDDMDKEDLNRYQIKHHRKSMGIGLEQPR